MTRAQKTTLAVSTGLLTFLTIALVTEHYLRVAAESTLLNVRSQYEVALGKQERVFNRSFMWYGTIVSVQPTENVLVIEFNNKFKPEAARFRLSVTVTPETVVYRQIPLTREGAYVGFSEEEVVTLRSVYSGERVAIVLRLNEAGEAEAETIIVGGAL